LPTTFTDPLGHKTVWFYDAVGRRTAMRRADGSVIDYTYDGLNRLTSIAAPGRAPWTMNYTSFGSPASIVAPGSGTTSFTYNNDFRRTQELVNAVNPINYTYDDDGLPTQIGGLSQTWDAINGQLTGSVLGGVSQMFAYTNFGELQNIHALAGGSAAFDQQLT